MAVVATLALPSGPARAVGACDAQKRLAPRKLGHPRPPLAIGDSVMLGAAEGLARAGLRVDARGCRQMQAGLDVLAHRHGTRVVILELGTNWVVTRGDIRRALRLIKPRHRLVLVTPAPAADAGDARVMRRAARRHPRRICLARWRAQAARHPDWAPGDGIHLSASGARAFVRLLKPYRRLIRHRSAPCPRS